MGFLKNVPMRYNLGDLTTKRRRVGVSMGEAGEAVGEKAISHAMVGRIAAEAAVPAKGVEAVLGLLEDGGTVPFIARYRKEATGHLDEVAILAIRDAHLRLAELEKRRTAILSSCAELGVLNESLKGAIDGAKTLSELEDIYLPYRPKKRTRASVARERGLEGLAVFLMKQRNESGALVGAAAKYVDPEKGVPDLDTALSGARDIVAEAISEHVSARRRIRDLYERRAAMSAEKPKKLDLSAKPEKEADLEGAKKYRDHWGTEIEARLAPSHRVHALLRGEREGFVKLRIAPPEEAALALLKSLFVRGSGEESAQVEIALADSYKRLLAPSMETELRASLKARADDDAIRVFAGNLRALLMAAPLGGRRVLAVDPGFRTGCKVVSLDEQGALLDNATIYPHPPQKRAEEAAEVLKKMIAGASAEFVVVGNGTAGRETESWIRSLGLPVTVVTVSESGASIYSASEVAREEFPDLDLTVRGAISIGRRLQDPLAELVKIDPKSIGVGQYQHDVDAARLKSALDDVVVSCVNQVGVEVGNASRQLLQYVSGLSATLAANVVKYRAENGPFVNRNELKKVPRLGPKAFEQCAGFLRIKGGDNPLDASAVHPENYGVVNRIAADLGCGVADLMADAGLRERIVPANYPEVGDATLTDILAELAKPGRDPRESFEILEFDENVRSIEDLQKGMTLPGVVSNVTDFGAFVDVGVHIDGLIHRSRMKGAQKNLHPGQIVRVEVLDVDLDRKRISLTPGESKVSPAKA